MGSESGADDSPEPSKAAARSATTSARAASLDALSARSLFAAAGPGSARVLGMRYLRLAAVAIVVALLLAVGMVFF
ncbi:MAG: hypothetical protein ACRDTQ_01970, partial [Micromonosporaceae bacterium]